MKPRSVTAEYEIKSNKLKKPVTVGLISDLHERDADEVVGHVDRAQLEPPSAVGLADERHVPRLALPVLAGEAHRRAGEGRRLRRARHGEAAERRHGQDGGFCFHC